MIFGMLLHHPLQFPISPTTFSTSLSLSKIKWLALKTTICFTSSMAVSLNSVISFNPAVNYQPVTRANIRVLLSTKIPSINSLSGLGQCTNWKKSRFNLLAAGADNIATETSDNDSKSFEESYSKNGSPDNGTTVSSSTTDDKNLNQEESGPKSSTPQKRAPLTARERLRAARVLSRYTDTKPSKPERGNKLLDALQESDVKGKKLSGLPQAPTNLFDDSKRGMPKQGWTFELPVGLDVFFIAFSFVFISSVMFATTYLVWKVGAIHFNEY